MNMREPSYTVDYDSPPAMRVLVVDDDAVTNRLLCRWLNRQGYHTAAAESGEAALDYLHDQAADIILLDVLLPGIDGLDVLRHIREQGLDSAVIMITASDTPDTAITALRHRADDYLRKPVVFSECELILDRTVGRLQLRRQNSALRHQLDEKRRQLEAELNRAAQVQADLLPQIMPALTGFELAARCIPAREVGGDFYDWDMPAPATLNLTLGDVMGKGMPAALLMATARAALHAVASQNPPGEAVSRVGHVLERDLDRSGSFVTLFHAQLDTASHRLSYCDAGHGHVFVRRANGCVEELEHRSAPLGVLPDEVYEPGIVYLNSGDALVLYSDGLADARPELVADRPALSAEMAQASSAQAMVDLLVGLVDQTQPLPDDLTIVVLRCTAAL